MKEAQEVSLGGEVRGVTPGLVTGERAVSSPFGAVRDYLVLTKPGIVVLLLITAYCAMVVADRGFPGLRVTTLTLFGLALSSGGANAINMWYDRDIDRIMHRTRRRPIPMGRLSPGQALGFGIVSEVVSIVLLAHWVNPLTAMLSFGGFVYYVFIYTIWLKRRTPQNIVIGGAAGAFPPLVGWAAIAGTVSPAALLMFLIIFLWTPTHFWSLALYRREDYERAHIPMMPVAAGEAVTNTQSVLYALLTLASSLALFFTHTVGILYLIVAATLGVGFVAFAGMSYRERLPETLWARRTFHFSLAYTTLVFAAMVLSVPGVVGRV